MEKIIIICDKSFKLKNEFSFLLKNYKIIFSSLDGLRLHKDKSHLIFCYTVTNNNFVFSNDFEENIKNIVNKKINVFLSVDKKFMFINKANYIFKNKFDMTPPQKTFELIKEGTVFDSFLFSKVKIEDTSYWEVKSIYDNNFDMIYDKNIPIICVNNFIKKNFINQAFFNLIYVINNKNFNLLYDISKLKYKNLRINIFIEKLDTEKLDILKMLINHNKKKNIRVTIVTNRLHKIYNYLFNTIVPFESLFFVKSNINDEKIAYINKKILLKNNIITEDYSIIKSSIFCEMLFLKSIQLNNYDIGQFHRLISNYLISNYSSTSYVYNKKASYELFPNNFEITSTILFMIKDYNRLFELINNEVKKCYDVQKSNTLLLKKVTTAILTNNESMINDQMASIFKYITGDKLLMDIYMLFEKTKFTSIKRDIIEKIIEKEGNDEKTIVTYLSKLLFLQPDKTSIKKLLDIIIKHLTTIKKLIAKKDLFVIQLTKCFMSFNKEENLLELYNKIINEFYNVNDMKNISELFDNPNFLTQDNIMINLILILATSFSPYYKNYSDFIDSRNKIYNNLLEIEKKINHTVKLNDLLTFSVNNFYLSYQGIPSVDIFKLKTKIVRKLCPEINYKIDTNFKNKKIKILFHAEQFNRLHSVYKDRHQVIKALSEDDRFDVYFSTFSEIKEEIKFTFGKAKHIILPNNLEDIKNRLVKEKLDIIVYSEIGMFPVSYYMAHMKLAKIQCNTWGHSDTSGIDTVDYYFSSKLYELPYEEAQTHYSEKLILQNSLCTSYVNPIAKYNRALFKPREFFGITNDVIVYFCAQSLFKLNPLYDDYIIEIIQNVPNAIIVLLENDEKARVIQRFNDKGIGHKIKFVPAMAHFGYMNLMNVSDIFLDVYPFGGCNSSFEAFSLGKIVVTQPSIMINGRFTTGFYKKMGLDDLICNSKEEYTNFAIKLGNDPEFRKETEQRIITNRECLYLDKETLQEWKDDMIKIYNEYEQK